MIENTNTKQFYPGPILNNTLEITDFLFNDAEQIKVTYSKFNEEQILVDVDLNYGTDYEVTKVLPSDINVAEAALTASTGQVIIKNINVLDGEKLTVYRLSELIQDKDYPRTGAFPAATHEGALDYLTMQNQEQQEELSRALKVPISTGEFNAAVPVPLPNRILRIDENATGFEFVPYDLDERLDTFEDTIEKTLETNKLELETNFSNFKLETKETLANNKTELEGIIEDNKQEVLSIQSDYQEEMDSKFQTVSDAADKINELESAVDTAVAAADNAVAAADNAVAAADNATEQANLAIDSVQNIETTSSQLKEEIIQEAEKQIENIQSTGFYMRDDKLYFINSKGEEEEFKSGGGTSLPIGFIGQTTVPIDESLGLQRYPNGSQMIINANNEEFVKTIERWSQIYPSMVTSSQDEWNTIKTLSVFGQCGKYFIDREQGYIQLPLIINAQGLGDLTNFSNIKPQTLPNIKATSSLGYLSSAGAFKKSSNTKTVSTYAGTTTGNSTDFEASRSSSVYQDGAPVQQEAIMYPYFIQIASGATTTIDVKNEVELNIPFFLGMSKYFDVQPNNLSWKQGGTILTNVEYPSYYELVVKVYNGTETVNGMSVKSIDENYTDYDFVLDSANEQFRLPLLNGSEDIPSDNKLDMELLANNTKYTAPANGWYTVQKTAGVNQGYIYIWNENNNLVNEWIATNQYYVSKVNLFVKKGDIVRVGYNLTGKTDYFGFVYAKGNGTLYYYVGETAQNANLINVPKIIENKANINASNFSDAGKSAITHMAMPSLKYTDLTIGATGTTYTMPSDGYMYLYAQASMVSFYGLYNDTRQYGTGNVANGNGYLTYFILPVNKGDIVSIRYQATASVFVLRFFYANGSESEAN